MTPREQRGPAPRTRDFQLEDGWTARVGRTDRDNDLLTFHDAFPQDLWLHARGCPGSHVVLHHDDAHEPPKAVLEAAGRLALQYSKASGAGTASVTVARIADLRKPRGAPAGQVAVRKSRHLRIRIQG